jgi:hypothetical protein
MSDEKKTIDETIQNTFVTHGNNVVLEELMKHFQKLGFDKFMNPELMSEFETLENKRLLEEEKSFPKPE